MNANKQHPFENDALDARLRRRLTAETKSEAKRS